MKRDQCLWTEEREIRHRKLACLRSKRSRTSSRTSRTKKRTAREFLHSGRAENGARAKKDEGKMGREQKGRGRGEGEGKKRTLARKPLKSEIPVRPRTGHLIGAAWFI